MEQAIVLSLMEASRPGKSMESNAASASPSSGPAPEVQGMPSSSSHHEAIKDQSTEGGGSQEATRLPLGSRGSGEDQIAGDLKTDCASAHTRTSDEEVEIDKLQKNFDSTAENVCSESQARGQGGISPLSDGGDSASGLETSFSARLSAAEGQNSSPQQAEPSSSGIYEGKTHSTLAFEMQMSTTSSAI